MFLPGKHRVKLAFGSDEKDAWMMARPHRIEFRASPDEQDTIARKAKIAGIPAATYARAAALGAAMPARTTRIEAEAIAALNRLGANLNQIGKAGNGKGLTPQQVQALASLHGRIREAVSEIKGMMK